MEVLLVLLIVAVWIDYARVSRLRADVERLTKRTTDLETKLKTAEVKPAPLEQSSTVVAEEATEAVRATDAPTAARPVVAPAPKPLTLLTPMPADARVASSPPRSFALKMPKIAWEQQLGARLPVWIGGIALALSGIFLVIYSIEQGYLSPLVRVSLAGGFGIVLLTAAQIILRQGKVANGQRIAQTLSGAGIAVLYGALFSASTVYGFISAPAAFLGMAAVTAVAVVLSLRQGPPTAILGMIGGFSTPALVGAGEPNAPVLFGYLIALTVGLFVLIRSQNWWWLAWPTLGAAFVWLILWLAGPSVPGDGLWLGLFLVLLSGTAFSFIAPTESKHSPPYAWLGLLLTAGAAVVFMAIVLGRNDFGETEWGFYVLITLGTLALAWRDQQQYRLLPWLTLGMSLFLLGFWQTADTEFFALVLVMLTAIFAVSGIIFLWRAKDPIEWTRLACVGSLAFFGLALAKLNDIVQLMSLVSGVPIWGLTAVLLAVVMTIVCGRIAERFGTKEANAQSMLSHVSFTAIAFLSLGMVLEIHPDSLPVAFAGAMLAVSWLSARTDINALRPATTVLAFLFVIVLLPQAVYVIQFALSATMGHALVIKAPALVLTPMFQLGVPALLFALSSFELRRKADDVTARAFEVSAAALLGVTGYFLILHAQAPASEILTTSGRQLDGVIITDALLVYALALIWMAKAFSRESLANAAIGAGLIAFTRITLFDADLISLFGHILAGVGGLNLNADRTIPIAVAPVFHLAPPVVLFAFLSISLQGVRERLAALFEYAAILFAGLMAYFLIRQVFHGAELAFSAPGNFLERGVITNAMLIFGAGLFVLGRIVNRKSIVAAGTVAVVLAVARIGYFDLLISSPLVAAHDVGTVPVLNALLLAYGLPVLWLYAIGRALEQSERAELALYAKAAAIAFVFIWISLNVRQFFQGPVLNAPGLGSNEVYAYSVAWLVLGVALLVAGVNWKDKIIRYASLVVMMLTVGKVFLYDASELTGLLRVFSFAGLGASLVGLSWFYTRYVFERGSPTQPVSGN